jgi:hypothetical protein
MLISTNDAAAFDRDRDIICLFDRDVRRDVCASRWHLGPNVAAGPERELLRVAGVEESPRGPSALFRFDHL